MELIPDQWPFLKSELYTAGFSQGTWRMMFEKKISYCCTLTVAFLSKCLKSSIEMSDIVRQFYFISHQSECHLLKAQSKYDAIF